jgi:hypothetical protein
MKWGGLLHAGRGATLVLGAIACAPQPALAETRALLAGVWVFNSPMFPNLKGPENDLAAMEAVVRGQGAKDVTVLRNAEVTRTGMETALHALGLRSKPGDWIVFYYSGHGAEADAAVKGTVDGDTDQFIPLAGFDDEHQDPEKFIVDKDFYAWLARYIAPDVHILMIADTCHSGTLNRSIDRASFRFVPRTGFRGDRAQFVLVPRPGPRFPAVLAGAGETVGAGNSGKSVDRPDLANLVYVGGAQDDQLALEAAMPVGGAPARGVMTWSLEQGLTTPGPDGKGLAADLDHDGKITPGELGLYLGSQVRALTGQRQEPRVTYVGAAGDLALFGKGGSVQKPAAPMLAAPAVLIMPGTAAPAGPGRDWRVTDRREDADFIWDVAKGQVFHRSGDVVADGVATEAALRGVIEKWGTIDALRPLLNESTVRIAVGPLPNGARYAPGAGLSIDLHYAGASTNGAPAYATIFNLASDGTIQRLFPLTGDDGEGRLGPGGTLPVVQNRAVAPYGADHIVALVTPAPPTALRALLRSVDGQRLAGRIVAPIRLALTGGGGLSIGEVYTGP